VVIHKLNLIGVAVAPCKTDAPLVIYADAVLTLSIAAQRFESITRQRRKGSDVGSSIQHVQFPKGLAVDGLEPADAFALEEAFGVGATEGPNHRLRVYCYPVNVKQYGGVDTLAGARDRRLQKAWRTRISGIDG
jgi:hypothetical protein